MDNIINDTEQYELIEEKLDEMPGYKSDEEVLDEVGVTVDVDDKYDMATRTGREKLAKDLHRLGNEFQNIAEGSQEPRKVTKKPALGQLEYEIVDDPVADEIEKRAYQNLAVKGVTSRHLDGDDIKEVLAQMTVTYHDSVSRFEEDNPYMQAIESLSTSDDEYGDLPDTPNDLFDDTDFSDFDL